MNQRFRLVYAQYANGSEEIVWTIIDMTELQVVHTTTRQEYAEYLCRILNKGNS